MIFMEANLRMCAFPADDEAQAEDEDYPQEDMGPSSASFDSQREPDGQPPLPDVPDASPILVLLNMLDDGILADDEEFQEVFHDISSECAEFGEVLEVHIPRPPEEQGVGKVFVEFGHIDDAIHASFQLHGRDFDEAIIQVAFLSEEDFDLGQLDNHSQPRGLHDMF